MESPSPTVRRRAWVRSSQHWRTLEDSNEEGHRQRIDSQVSVADDDVFFDGCSSGSVERWLLGCGPEGSFGSSAHPTDSSLQASNCEDDLGLGVDAFTLNLSKSGSEIMSPTLPPPQGERKRGRSSSSKKPNLPSLNLGDSMTSSCLSSASSVSEVLDLCSEDVEETLYQLGFGSEVPEVTARIPSRFFSFPSQLHGINFRMFLEAQLQRIREEDPSLSLASRFRQVEVLTAMANAFYSLYSHVSRTPLQKLPPPELSLSPSPRETIRRFMGSVRSEPRSPVERLKDVVSKMCLYTGSSLGSDPASPQLSPRRPSALSDVVEIVLENTKSLAVKKLDLGEDNVNNLSDSRENNNRDRLSDDKLEEQSQQTAEGTNPFLHSHATCDQKLNCEQQAIFKTYEEAGQPAVLGSSGIGGVRTSLWPSLGQTVTDTGCDCVTNKPWMDISSTPTVIPEALGNKLHVDLTPVSKVTYDVICKQIVESVHQAPLYCQQIHRDNANCGSQKPCGSMAQLSHSSSATSTACAEDEGGNSSGKSEVRHLNSESLFQHRVSSPPCRITVTGLEGDGSSSASFPAPDSSHSSGRPTGWMGPQSVGRGRGRYLSPGKRGGQACTCLPQANSFELEELLSAGEDDPWLPETSTPLSSSSSSSKLQCKGHVVRGDSMQSDSSGYADDDSNLCTNKSTKQQVMEPRTG